MNGWQTNGQPATGPGVTTAQILAGVGLILPLAVGVLITRALAAPVAAPLLGMPPGRR